jgi:alpha-D-xyloside xylohydrolase
MRTLLFAFCLFVGFSAPGSSQSLLRESDGIRMTSPSPRDGVRQVRLRIWSENVIEVAASPADTFSSRESLVVPGDPHSPHDWQILETRSHVSLLTPRMKATVDRQTLSVRFFDSEGKPILAEGPRELRPTVVAGERCFQAKQSFLTTPGEALYGLGSYQDADLRLNGKKISMVQKNRDDVVPVVLSTNRYGLLWDNASFGEFNDTRGSYYLWSNVADDIRYYVISGGSFDAIVAGYRSLTGRAPMYPKWAFGYFQSKQKYNTQEEVLSVVRQFREKKFPMDVIVQDWMYWPDGQWGEKRFNRAKYPDPARMVDTIHSLNAHVIISIWPNMAKGSANQRELAASGGLLSDNEHLDVLNPEARKIYWRQAKDSIFSAGIDGWWADCSEGYDSDWLKPNFFKMSPEQSTAACVSEMTGLMGSGRNINAYALMHTKGIYEGQRSSASDKRVFILTRSAFAGMQRYGASYWTGDVSANWEEFRMQIPAGLNYCMTGLPYWTTDIAGYFIKREPGWWFSNGAFELGQSDTGFCELYTRWFQFAAFSPLFRAHGADFPREPWAFGPPESPTYRTLLAFTQLRYRLMPYIYSLAWQVTDAHATIMRALPFDFLGDSLTYGINDQYLFGRALMVCPVVTPLYHYPGNVPIKTTDFTRGVYLPKGTGWVDFWTGSGYEGGQTIRADARYETMPLFVRKGSIIPMGPVIEYAAEKSDPVELRIYPGADGEFVLYEDENDSYRYLDGKSSRISLRWADHERKLTIGARQGSFPGMPEERTFNVVVVRPRSGTPVEPSTAIDRRVSYNGKEVAVQLD